MPDMKTWSYKACWKKFSRAGICIVDGEKWLGKAGQGKFLKKAAGAVVM
ncbi:MAG: hypothetical protein HY740_07420 [Chloroflexi bacterium]|nr:hypothetical protein [Chloroflexota bacterium]